LFFTTDAELSRSLRALGALAGSPRATVNVIEAFAKIEQTLGMNGILDFYNADPRAFTPPSGGTYVSEEYNHFERVLHAVPAFRRSMDQLANSAGGDLAYAVICVRWPQARQYTDFRKGIPVRFGFADAAIVLTPKGYPRPKENTIGQLAARTVFDVRGSFEYSGSGAFVVAMNVAEVEQYFDLSSPWYGIRSGQDVYMPAGNILDLIGAPSGEEQELLNALLRAYWVRLAQKFGYEALPTDRERIDGRKSRDPYTGEIPSTLFLPSDLSARVGLGSRHDAQGVLEGWHRVSQINAVIAEHQRSLLTEGV
jgi:hypothetical protein